MFRIAILLVFCGVTSCTHKPMYPQPVPTSEKCPLATPSFNRDIQPVLQVSCAKAGCHDAVSMPHNYAQYSELQPILADSTFYYYVIKDRRMPEDGALDASSYLLIRCWFMNGHPDN